MTDDKQRKNVGKVKPVMRTRPVKVIITPPPIHSSTSKKENRSPKINVDTYNKLQEAYFRHQNISQAARDAGVSQKTAKVYIDGPGKPEIGFIPIKQVWLDVQTESQERRQLSLVKFQEKMSAELEGIIETNIAELRLIRADVQRRVKAFKDSGGVTIETGTTMNTSLRTFEKAVRLMERLLGAADITIKAEGEDRYARWTDEEIVAFMQTGTYPAHERQ